jgi:hypothetical protein
LTEAQARAHTKTWTKVLCYGMSTQIKQIADKYPSLDTLCRKTVGKLNEIVAATDFHKPTKTWVTPDGISHRRKKEVTWPPKS